ncbi:hypothetical protein [uncultured Prevotella sp.]|uniref:hypothetical protein n=1 Tax=uncultured Prevotella sp. TaxID=159272 RepID=UPI0026769239|nr:hypothetical protein [uncultured Prevotella sp.]
MSYDRDIIFILNEAGPKGLSVKKIARHVYNHNNGFFNVVSFEDVYRYVSSYLIRTSKVLDSIIEKTDERGVYRINNSSKMSLQLQFEFCDDEEKEEPENKHEDLSLSLF